MPSTISLRVRCRTSFLPESPMWRRSCSPVTGCTFVHTYISAIGHGSHQQPRAMCGSAAVIASIVPITRLAVWGRTTQRTPSLLHASALSTHFFVSAFHLRSCVSG